MEFSRCARSPMPHLPRVPLKPGYAGPTDLSKLNSALAERLTEVTRST